MSGEQQLDLGEVFSSSVKSTTLPLALNHRCVRDAVARAKGPSTSAEPMLAYDYIEHSGLKYGPIS
jgi:hypothetical protein